MLVAHRAVESEAELAAASATTYDEPREIACFSRAADRSVRCNDRSQLRAFVRPELETDLNKGFDTFVDKRAGDAPIDDILDALAHKQLDTSQSHILTYRNNLNKLLGTPYNVRDEWQIGVSRHGRTVHLHVLESEAKAARERARSEQERRMAYWGYAFEHAATATERVVGLSDEEERERPVDCNAEFVSIVQTKLGGNRLIIAAEVDCERRGFGETGGGSHATRKYLELKTSKLLSDEHARRALERKMQKWFLQSFLLGVPTVACGFRDDAGLLKKTQDFEVKQLPKFVHGAWKPHVMLNFGSVALGWLYECVISGPPAARYVLAYEPAQRRLALRIAPEGVVPDPRAPPASNDEAVPAAPQQGSGKRGPGHGSAPAGGSAAGRVLASNDAASAADAPARKRSRPQG